MNTIDIEDKERIIKTLDEHIERTKSPHIFTAYLRKQLNLESGSRFHGLILELIQEGILEYVQSNNQNTNVMFSIEGKKVAKIGYSKYLTKIRESENEKESTKQIESKILKFNYNWRYIILGITILGFMIAVLSYFKPIN